MAVKLSKDQEQVIREVWDEGDRVGATPMEKLSAIMTIGVEANYKNVRYGDRDSQGPFQQRPSQGWGTIDQITNVRHSARSYYKTAKQMRQSQDFKRAGDLAAAVQRPAEQYRGRYEGKRGEALSIINQLGLGGGSGGGGGGGAGGMLAEQLNGADPKTQAFDPTRGPVSALEITTPVAPAATAPPAPAAAQLAQPVMPEMYPGAPQAGAPEPKAPAELMQTPDYSQAFGGEQQAQQEAGAAGGSSAAPAGGAQGKGKVTIVSGANRSGVPMQKPMLDLLERVSAESGRELRVTTGTNHSQMTTTGNESEHWRGFGADMAMKGQELTDAGVDALLVTARGKKVQWLRNDGRVVTTRVTAANARRIVEAGGIFNVPEDGGGRIQVIVNTHQGGDHTNHLHMGYRPGQK